MEDYYGHFELIGGRFHVAFVCDGHGGAQVAAMIADGGLQQALGARLADALAVAQRPKSSGRGETGMARAFVDAFADLDAKARARDCKASCGSTLCVLVVDRFSRRAYVANCGDSGCLAIGFEDPGPGGGAPRAKMLARTKDHVAASPCERFRITEAGGIVIHYKGAYRVMGSLVVSRAIGDHGLKDYVPSTPDVTVVDLDDCGGPACFVLASDGLWHRSSDLDVMATVHDVAQGKLVKAHAKETFCDACSRMLVRRAGGAGRHMDNTTVIAMTVVEPKYLVSRGTPRFVG